MELTLMSVSKGMVKLHMHTMNIKSYVYNEIRYTTEGH